MSLCRFTLTWTRRILVEMKANTFLWCPYRSIFIGFSLFWQFYTTINHFCWRSTSEHHIDILSIIMVDEKFRVERNFRKPKKLKVYKKIIRCSMSDLDKKKKLVTTESLVHPFYYSCHRCSFFFWKTSQLICVG